MWQSYVEVSRHVIGKVDWKFREKDVYVIIFDRAFNDNDTDSVSSSPGLVEIIKELPSNSFNDKVLSSYLVFHNDPRGKNF